MKPKFACVLIIFISCIFILSCEKEDIERSGDINGIVSSEGYPINNAVVKLNELLGDTTDSEGKYSFENLEPKLYRIDIIKDGYVTYNDSIEIKNGENLITNFEIIKVSAPVITTGLTSDLTQTTTEISGHLVSLGAGYSSVTQHGHCWSTSSSPTIDNSKTELGTLTITGTFNSHMSGLSARTHYYVRAYAKTDSEVFYGNETDFITKAYPPKILDFSPKSGPIGTRIEITGENFAPPFAEHSVKLGNYSAEIISATENVIIIEVPSIDKTEKVNISITQDEMTAISADLFELWFPWSQKNEHNVNAYKSASFVLNNFGYLIGANSLYMSKYNPENDEWINNIVLPENSGDKPLVFVLDNRVFALLNNGFWEYNGVTNSWTEKERFPGTLQNDRRYNFNLSIEDRLYIGNCYKNYDFWEYNPNDDTWKRKADCLKNFDSSNPVWGNYTFTLNQKGYLGISQTGFAINTLWEYIPSEDLWIEKKGLPSNAYTSYACFVIDNVAYIGLGRNFEWGDGYVSNAIWKYDEANDDWIKFRDCPVNMTAYNSFSINDKGYVIPGYTKFDKSIYHVWEFDPSKN